MREEKVLGIDDDYIACQGCGDDIEVGEDYVLVEDELNTLSGKWHQHCLEAWDDLANWEEEEEDDTD